MEEARTTNKGRNTSSRGTKRDVYAEVTSRVIEAMQRDGIAPWRRPWTLSARGSSLPRNAVSGRPYRGVNVVLTMLTAMERGYQSPCWVTFKQANELAGRAHRVQGRKVEQDRRGRWVFADGPDQGKSCGGIMAGQNKGSGSGATEILFWKSGEAEDQDEDGEPTTRRWMMTRTYSVFNVEQCDEHVRRYVAELDKEASEEREEQATDSFEVAERICRGFDVPVRHGGNRAFYSPVTDSITLPPRRSFKSQEHYYSVRFHEMGHATGHASRLARDGVTSFDWKGSHQYADEELVAEFTACLLSAEAGFGRVTEPQSAAYLKTWAAKLKDDPRIIVWAAQRAQRAADLILGRTAEGEPRSGHVHTAEGTNPRSGQRGPCARREQLVLDSFLPRAAEQLALLSS